MEWKERYNCHSLKVNGLFTIHINWGMSGEGGDVIKYGNLRVKKAIPDIKTAKRVALKNVSKHLHKAMADIAVIREGGEND